MRAPVVLAGAFLLAACGAGGSASPAGSSASPREYRVATGIATRNSNTAGLAGVVHGRANSDGTACFWIEHSAKPGTPAGRVAILWPHGSRAYADPLRVVGPDGDVIATVGRSVSLGGGSLGPERLPVTGCPDIPEAFG